MTTEKVQPIVLKLVMIGDAGVGKSSILMRFTDDKFDNEHLSTIGVDLKVKMVDVENKKVKITIWDTAGQERFRTLTASYFHKVQGLILTYDVTRRETFDNLNMWNEEIEVNTDGAPVIKVLVGNKIDESDKREVLRKEGEAWAQEHAMLFIETSAKTRVGIQQVFMECVRQILQSPSLLSTTSGGGGTILTSSSEAKKDDTAQQGCCM